MENKNKNENQFAGDSAPEIDEAARRLNEQILWENTVNGSYKEEEDANQDGPSGGQYVRCFETVGPAVFFI